MPVLVSCPIFSQIWGRMLPITPWKEKTELIHQSHLGQYFQDLIFNQSLL